MSDIESDYDENEVLEILPQEQVRDIYECIKLECEYLFNNLTEEDLLEFLYPNYNIYNPFQNLNEK
jgi:hypothetical protein